MLYGEEPVIERLRALSDCIDGGPPGMSSLRLVCSLRCVVIQESVLKIILPLL